MLGVVGTEPPRIENGVVTALRIVSDNLSDISPLAALPGLKNLNCSGSGEGKSKLSEISPLAGMKLSQFYCGYTLIADFTPLQGMPLTVLKCGYSAVADLSPLQGAPLTTFDCRNTKVSSLLPLQGMKLKDIHLTPKNIIQGMDVIRQMISLQSIGTNGTSGLPVAEFWKKYDAGEFGKPLTDINSPAFQKWMKDVAALPGEKLADAVLAKLQELNPGFDGKPKFKKIEDRVVTEFGIYTDDVTDLSPVRALVGLKSFDCTGSYKNQSWGKLTDLSPLRGMSLKWLNCMTNPVADLSPLEGMPLTKLLCASTNVADLSSLKGSPLVELNCAHTKITDLTSLEGLPLANLYCDNNKLSDISALKSSPLGVLLCDHTQVSDLSPLTDCKGLKYLEVEATKVSPASVAALQKVLPNCKIVWDDPAKPKAAAKPSAAFNNPAFQAWMKDVAAMPAEKQADAVAKKLQELNPGFDGKVTGLYGQGAPKIENGAVTAFEFVTGEVSDISPVRALTGLKVLTVTSDALGRTKLADLLPIQGMTLTGFYCNGTQVSDLSALAGMKLTGHNCSFTRVSDLSPLEGMPLTTLNCGATKVSSLSALKGMPLTKLECYYTPVTDLSPLSGMHLTHLDIGGTSVSDLSAIQGMPLNFLVIDGTSVTDVSPERGMNLTTIAFTPKNITKGVEVVREMKSLKAIGLRGEKNALMPTEFWKKYDAGEFGKPNTTLNDPAFQAWLKEASALSGQKQWDAVNKKMQELNAGYDGKIKPQIKQGVVTELQIASTDVLNIAPLRALTGLKALRVYAGEKGKGGVSDLSPLAGLQLTALGYVSLHVNDLSPIRGMPLTFLDCGYSTISDLSPLEGMQLTDLRCGHSKVADLSVLKGMPITFLQVQKTSVSDLTPLHGMPLTTVSCSDTPIADLSPLASCKSLTSLECHHTKVTAANVAALQKALPDCKIDWDDPAKPATPAK